MISFSLLHVCFFRISWAFLTNKTNLPKFILKYLNLNDYFVYLQKDADAHLTNYGHMLIIRDKGGE